MTAPVAPLPEGETLPCPFCGEQPEITKHFKEDAWRLVHRCDVMGALVLDWTEPRRRHVDTWNTRTAERRGRESAAAEIERLQAAIAQNIEQFKVDTLAMSAAETEIHRLRDYEEAAHNVADMALAATARAEKARARIAALETTLAERDRRIAHEIYDKGKIQRRHDFQANRASSAEAHVAVLETLLRRWLDCPEVAEIDPEDRAEETDVLERETRKALAAPAAPREEGT